VTPNGHPAFLSREKIMTELKNTEAIKETLQGLAKVVKTTHRILAQIIRHPARQPTPERLRRFSNTLEYMGDFYEGFMLSQRVSAHTEVEDLHQLGRQVLLDWQWLEAMNLSVTPDDEVKVIDNQLITYQHAAMALGTLPNLPIEAITFPQPRPGYADILAPTTPGEMLERIEEIEHVIYRAGIVPLNHIAHESVRRTYAFFEAGTWLSKQYPPAVLTD
jgi:hypothetical protein